MLLQFFMGNNHVKKAGCLGGGRGLAKGDGEKDRGGGEEKEQSKMARIRNPKLHSSLQK